MKNDNLHAKNSIKPIFKRAGIRSVNKINLFKKKFNIFSIHCVANTAIIVLIYAFVTE